MPAAAMTIPPPMPSGRRRTPEQRSGDWAEQRALRLLRAAGWRLLARQWRCRWGELDLVLHKPQRLLLVEVKARRCRPGGAWGRAGLGPRKLRRLERAWACWIEAHPLLATCPVELVYALVPLPPGRQPVRWIRPRL